MVDAVHVNLAHPWPGLPTMNVVFLRNVKIYMSDDTRRAILAQMRRVLAPDGYLFLGSSETTLTIDGTFQPVGVGGGLCYQLVPSGRRLTTDDADPARNRRAARPVLADHHPGSAPAQPTREGRWQRS